MSLLGVVLAGGGSRRFGTDKALALLDGRTLLDHSVAALAAHCAEVAVAGRKVAGLSFAADNPRPGLGPLGGLAGALHLAVKAGHDAVLSCGVDCVILPADLISLLSPGPAYVADQPVIGLWPVTLCEPLDAFIATNAKHSVYGFAEHVRARGVRGPTPIANINFPDDLARIADHLDKR